MNKGSTEIPNQLPGFYIITRQIDYYIQNNKSNNNLKLTMVKDKMDTVILCPVTPAH